MKAIQWIILFLLSAMGVEMLHAQGIRVYKRDGTVLTLPYNEVDSLVAYAYVSGGDYAGHEYVDLGLSVKWATCNVGASSPSDYGDYYAWGEVSPKSSYTSENSAAYGKTMGDISGDSRYDAARFNWGGTWRMPTKSELTELKTRCTWTWTTMNGKNGYKITGSNGNSIFLPAAGFRDGTSLGNDGSGGDYWSSSPDESTTNYAYILDFYLSHFYLHYSYRYYGRSVRPVTE